MSDRREALIFRLVIVQFSFLKPLRRGLSPALSLGVAELRQQHDPARVTRRQGSNPAFWPDFGASFSPLVGHRDRVVPDSHRHATYMESPFALADFCFSRGSLQLV